ncbi:hypothetical protein [Actinomycetospora cinnamomea]|uniref:Uncharacterized protein n=1 Tax=Actinomycetospora cinnamomea TaxID=663609 RepID=A0A2U1F3V7_9PSEU|nr:hypothetical protein [Actinomycetospora cinnamomea]PVZ06842.1 hypothetical protein C8D89_11235 [Actinomycetospora cinnamomea]
MSLLGNLRDLIGDLPEDGRPCPPPEPTPVGAVPAPPGRGTGFGGAPGWPMRWATRVSTRCPTTVRSVA